MAFLAWTGVDVPLQVWQAAGEQRA
ncbi:hypothetical protein ACFP81_02580 [Deinococcus lacus]|uniref:Uncharacterized protein n=1 Tax=Deinococcus lacus TaxID=392561 RepID=A0ABW1YA26_9DEIO